MPYNEMSRGRQVGLSGYSRNNARVFVSHYLVGKLCPMHRQAAIALTDHRRRRLQRQGLRHHRCCAGAGGYLGITAPVLAALAQTEAVLAFPGEQRQDHILCS